MRGLKVVVTWVHLYQWGDAIVKGDADTKSLGTPALDDWKVNLDDKWCLCISNFETGGNGAAIEMETVFVMTY